MNSLSLRQILLPLVASLFLLASCGSTAEPATAATPSVAVATPTEVAPVEESTSVAVEETTSTPPDDRTEQEIAVDRLDLMMIQLGIDKLEDLEDATSCVIDRLESENIEFTGEGTSDLIALSACNDTIISAWLPSTNPALPDEVWACTVENIGEWISELSVPDAEAFFSAASPPQDFIEHIADQCNASAEDIAAAF